MPDRDWGEIRVRARTEDSHDPVLVEFNGLYGDIQYGRNLFQALSFRRRLEDFLLTRSQQRVGLRLNGLAWAGVWSEWLLHAVTAVRLIRADLYEVRYAMMGAAGTSKP